MTKKHFPKSPDNRMCDTIGEIDNKRADTLVGTLRGEYGKEFALGYRSDTKLKTVLRKEGVETLDQLLKNSKTTIAYGLSKFQRCCRPQHTKGMRLLRLWVPDTHRPEFAKEAARQSALLRNDPQEKEVLQFIEDVADFSGWQP
jgi:hypothetical protein